MHNMRYKNFSKIKLTSKMTVDGFDRKLNDLFIIK